MGWASQEQLASEGSLKVKLSTKLSAPEQDSKGKQEAEAEKVDGVDPGCQGLFLGHSKDQEGDSKCVHGVACHSKGQIRDEDPQEISGEVGYLRLSPVDSCG